MKRKQITKSTVLATALFLTDVLSFYSSLYLAYNLRLILNKITPFQLVVPFQDYLAFFWMPLIYFLFVAYEGLYTKRLPFFEEWRRLSKAITLGTVTLFAILSLGKISDEVSRLLCSFLMTFMFAFMALFRFATRRLLYTTGIALERVVIIGAGQAARAAARDLLKEKNLGYVLLGFFDDKKSVIKKPIQIGTREYPVVSNLRAAPAFIQKQQVKTVIFAIPSIELKKMTKWVKELQQIAPTVMFVPNIKGVALLNTDLYPLFDEQIFLIKIKNNLDSIMNQIIKRVFDLFFALALLPFILPVFMLLALAIRFDSRGPVFFIQDRLGFDFSSFKCVKFRTMYHNSNDILNQYLKENSDAAAEWKQFKKLKSHDPRVTRVGRFLRNTSLDELPQVFNILVGQMSFVGPRPYISTEFKELYIDASTIVKAKPGLSGLWQVSGRNQLDFETRIAMDNWYILNWSLWLDLSIIIRTIGVVLKKQGAY